MALPGVLPIGAGGEMAPYKIALQDFTAVVPKSLVYYCRQELQSTVSKGSTLLGRNLECLQEAEKAEECQVP